MTSEIEKRVQQIKTFAKDHEISYTVMLDMLEDKNPPLTDEVIAQVVEELAADGISLNTADTDADAEDINADPESFIPANVNISQNTMTIWNLMERLKFQEFDLHPGFQRRDNLWSDERQSRLIESLMLKIPLPTFYFDASDDDKWKVIDGLQRLSAIENYLVGVADPHDPSAERRLKPFSGLEYLREFNGLTFDQLPRQYIRRIQETQVITYKVEKGTPDAVVFNIFQRINTGGLRLEPQEIRHALYQGPSTRLTQELARSSEFIDATGNAVLADRMQDLELVTRFIAFTELDYRKSYNDDINSFLNKTLKTVNDYSQDGLDRIRSNFRRAMVWSSRLFGKYAFRKYNASWRRSPINKAMFELWAICFKDMSEEDAETLIGRREEFLEKFKDLQQTPEFKTSFDSTKSPSLNRRVKLTKHFLEDFLCCKTLS